MNTPSIRLAAAILCLASLSANNAIAMDDNHTWDQACGLKTGYSGTDASNNSFWVTWAYNTCVALGGDYAIPVAEKIGELYDDEFGDVTFYKNPSNNKEYYVQKKNGQHRLGQGPHFVAVPPPPVHLVLPNALPNPQTGPTITYAGLKAKQEAAKQAAAKQKAAMLESFTNKVGPVKPKP